MDGAARSIGLNSQPRVKLRPNRREFTHGRQDALRRRPGDQPRGLRQPDGADPPRLDHPVPRCRVVHPTLRARCRWLRLRSVRHADAPPPRGPHHRSASRGAHRAGAVGPGGDHDPDARPRRGGRAHPAARRGVRTGPRVRHRRGRGARCELRVLRPVRHTGAGRAAGRRTDPSGLGRVAGVGDDGAPGSARHRGDGARRRGPRRLRQHLGVTLVLSSAGARCRPRGRGDQQAPGRAFRPAARLGHDPRRRARAAPEGGLRTARHRHLARRLRARHARDRHAGPAAGVRGAARGCRSRGGCPSIRW